MFFYGILAVGTQEGHIYLVDLALDDDTEENKDQHVSTESHPASLHFIRNSGGNIAEMRQSVMRRGQHLSLSLNDRCFRSTKAFQHLSSMCGKT